MKAQCIIVCFQGWFCCVFAHTEPQTRFRTLYGCCCNSENPTGISILHIYSRAIIKLSCTMWYCFGVVHPSVRSISVRPSRFSVFIVILQVYVLAYEDGSHQVSQ